MLDVERGEMSRRALQGSVSAMKNGSKPTSIFQRAVTNLGVRGLHDRLLIVRDSDDISLCEN